MDWGTGKLLKGEHYSRGILIKEIRYPSYVLLVSLTIGTFELLGLVHNATPSKKKVVFEVYVLCKYLLTY